MCFCLVFFFFHISTQLWFKLVSLVQRIIFFPKYHVTVTTSIQNNEPYGTNKIDKSSNEALMARAHFSLLYNCDAIKITSVFVNFIDNSVFFVNFLSKVLQLFQNSCRSSSCNILMTIM